MAVEPMAMPAPVGLEMFQPTAAAVAVELPLPTTAATAAPTSLSVGAAITTEAVRDGTRDLVYAAAKRFLDVTAAALLLVMLLPLFVAVALAISLDSRGPVLYRAERVGLLGRRFRVVKFRSMRADADSGAHAKFIRGLMQGDGTCAIYKVPNDSRITRVGRILRRTSIDELPQLWNVLRGEMSLVGPRPDVPYATDSYEPWMRRRLRVKPGLTGLWQVSGRSRLSLLDMYRLDTTYAETASLAVDLRILARTIPAVLHAEDAA
jgi:lipopolysaccharide/colanic/teichoic acid biosynthesis glycosyltransferase